MNTCLSGVWTNSSHTGSTGKYRLIGRSSKASPSKELGQSLTHYLYLLEKHSRWG